MSSSSKSSNRALFGFIRAAFTVLVILAVVYVTVQLAMVGYDFGYRVFTEPAMSAAPGHDVPVLVKDDMSDLAIAKMLEEKGLIRDKNLGFLQIKLSAYSGKTIPGAYTLNTSMDVKEMMYIMSTVPEVLPEEDDTTGGVDEGTATVEGDGDGQTPPTTEAPSN